MAINVTKPAINLREKLNEVTLETGIKGEELLNSDTSTEARNVLELDTHLFTDFESTGIDDNATSTAITIAASERVTLANDLVIPSTGIIYLDGASNTYIREIASDKIQIVAGGVVSAELTGSALTAYGNLVIGTSGKGIDFSADGNAAGATSEVLDDYETGTFTMKFRRSGGTWINGTTNGAQYIKIGSRVFVTYVGQLDSDLSTADGSSYVRIGGLPFNVSLEGMGTVHVRYTKQTLLTDLMWNIQNEGYIFESNTGSGSLAHTFIDSGSTLHLSGSFVSD